MSEQKKREIAFKVRINDVLKGEYVKRDGWDPNFININNKQVSRVNIMGVVVSIPDSGQNNLTIDDGSGRIEVRSFDNPEMLTSSAIGDIVMMIGRPREYNNARYIIAEVLRKVENKKWMEVRKLELEAIPPIKNVEGSPPTEPVQASPSEQVMEQPPIESVQKNPSEQVMEQPEVKTVNENPNPVKEAQPGVESSEPKNVSESVYDIIKKLDNGDGAVTEEVIKASSSPDAEKLVENLLKDGEIFEPAPGKLKVLE